MSEITIPGDGPFMEHIDLTHPASENLATPAVVEAIKQDDSHDQQPIEVLTEEEQAAIDAIGDHSKDKASAKTNTKKK